MRLYFTVLLSGAKDKAVEIEQFSAKVTYFSFWPGILLSEHEEVGL